MKAADVMSAPVISVKPGTPVLEAVHLMLQNGISGLPVVDEAGRLVGLVTEGDLLRRGETGTERHRPRWIEFLRSGRLAEEYTRSHARKVEDVMTAKIVTASEDTPLDQVVDLMERRRIKRVPILRDGKAVGIVSRSDLLRALARLAAEAPPAPEGDAAIRERLAAELAGQSWAPRTVRFTVRDGAVEFSGVIFDESDRAALRVAAEGVPGVKSVRDRLIWVEPMSGLPVLDADELEGGTPPKP